MKAKVLRAIQSLPDSQRTVTTLFYINGYSQETIAEFLEVPPGTVKSRLAASRNRLKQRMMEMVKETLHASAPDERFSRKVIEELLGRPKLLEIEGHPVRRVWEAIRRALPDYEVVSGSEVEDEPTAKAAEDHAWEKHAYHLGDDKALRYQMATVTMSAIRGRTPPVRLLAAGRVFRPDREDATHCKVFHQVDGVCVQSGAGVDAYKSTCERLLESAAPGLKVLWRQHDYGGFVAPGFCAMLECPQRRCEVLGGGMLQPKTLKQAGFDPRKVGGFAWGVSLERIAMLTLGLDDIRKLWAPPYVPWQH
jgi:phenylalanyl-tRNA synthetase alpha chain